MHNLRGVILDIDSLYPDDLDLSPILGISGIRWQTHSNSSPDQVAAHIRSADIVLTNKALVDKSAINGALKLRYIGVLATGMNAVDLDAAHERKIKVTNITNYGTIAVAQHTFALILALTTQLTSNIKAARDGRWSASNHFCLLDFPARELAGKTLGIVGYGVLGKAVAHIGRAFGMAVIAARVPGHNSSTTDVERLSMNKFLRRSDVISVHCPLSDNTRGLIGSEELAAMKPSALLVNCARGGIVNEVALANALRQGLIAGAGTDVLGDEPPPPDHVLLKTDIPNLLVTPHCAWGTREARQRLVNQAGSHLRKIL